MQQHVEQIEVGIVLESRRVASPWAQQSWSAAAVLLGIPDLVPWQPMQACEEATRIFAGMLTVRLHRTQTEGYRANLSRAEPAIFVVLRRTDDEARPVEPFLATACPYEAQNYMEAGEEIVEAVPAPAALVARIGRFVAMHHVDAPFEKRRRKPGHASSAESLPAVAPEARKGARQRG